MTSPRNFLQLALLAGVATCLDTPACAAEADLDLTHAVVVAPASISARENKAVLMLIEEIEKRAQIRLTRSVAPPTDSTPSIQIQRTASAGAGREGYSITVATNTVHLTGNDERGVLFG